MHLNVLVDGRNEIRDALEDAPADSLGGEVPEPSLDEIFRALVSSRIISYMQTVD